MWVDGLQLGQDLARVVGAGVIADDDLIVIGQIAQRAIRGDHDRGNRAGVVVARKERGDGWSGHQLAPDHATASARAWTPNGRPVTRSTSRGQEKRAPGMNSSRLM